MLFDDYIEALLEATGDKKKDSDNKDEQENKDSGKPKAKDKDNTPDEDDESEDAEKDDEEDDDEDVTDDDETDSDVKDDEDVPDDDETDTEDETDPDTDSEDASAEQAPEAPKGSISDLNLLRDFSELHRTVKDNSQMLSDSKRSDILSSRVVNQVTNNLTVLYSSIYRYIVELYDTKKYVENLYQYGCYIQAFRINIEMLKKIKDLYE
jgi:cobalamin biosynthesis protein CobT